MRFIPRVLPCNASRCASISLLLSLLAAPVALSQDAAKAKPKPHVSYDGPALTFDFPGVKVGVAEYEEGPTGTTVLYFPTPVVAAVDVRGGAPGTVNTDVLRLAYDDPVVNAIVLSGGSAYACLPPPASTMRSRACLRTRATLTMWLWFRELSFSILVTAASTPLLLTSNWDERHWKVRGPVGSL